MDIHKPKPWHGLREFLKEYLIVVVGVLTALGAEQFVESLHWRHKLESAEENMRAEQRDDDLPQAYVRAALGLCYRDQLRHIRASLDQPGPDRQQFLKLIDAYRPPIRTWDSQAWAAVTDSDVAAHLEPDRRIHWAAIYNPMPRLQNLNWDEDAILSKIQGVRRLKGALSDQEAGELAQETGRLQALNATMSEDSMEILASARDLGIEVPRPAREKLDAMLRSRFGGCVVRPNPHIGTMNDDPLDARLPDGDFKVQ
jgi:hypothetical protein